MTNIDAVLSYARSFLGVPYHWGGNNRLTGLDCSGFVCEVLRSFGMLAPDEDLNCDSLYAQLVKIGPHGPSLVAFHPTHFIPGQVLFFGDSIKQLHHVAIAVDLFRMIEAGGGDKSCTSPFVAARTGAMVRERMICRRKDLITSVLPTYPNIYGN